MDKIHHIDTSFSKTIPPTRMREPLQHTPSFKNSSGLNLVRNISENPLITLMTIDLLGMIIPRIGIDTFRNRKELGHLNYDAGRETTFRELVSCFVYTFLPGMLAVKVGNNTLTSKNNKLNINTTSFIDNATLDKSKGIIDTVLNNYKEPLITPKSLNIIKESFATAYFNNTLGIDQAGINTLVQEIKKGIVSSNENGMIILNKPFLEKFIDEHQQTKLGNKLTKLSSLMEYINNNSNETTNTKHIRKLLSLKDSYYTLMADNLTHKIAIGSNARKVARKDVEVIIRDAFIFTDDLIDKAFNLAKKNKTGQAISKSHYQDALHDVYKEFKKIKNMKLFIAFGVSILASISMPVVNNWITKKSTGRTDFVGEFGLTDKVSEKNTRLKKRTTQMNRSV